MIINPAYYPLFSSVKRLNILKGGAGAGKSRAIAQLLIRNITSKDDYKVLCLTKIGAMLSATVFAELKTVISSLNADHLFTVTSSPLRIKCNANGNEIIFRGMDDENKLKSISGISAIWMEEADGFTVQDFLQANTRIRGKSVHTKQIFISFNPTSELSWLKSAFFDEGNPYEEKSFVLETTYRDNNYLEREDVEALELSGKLDMNFMRVYLNGEWGQATTDGLFYKHFSSFVHVTEDAIYNPELPIWLSFDFNVQPYCACTAWQLQDNGKTVYLFDEYTLKSPRNTTKYVCQEFKKRHPFHTAGLFITGDPNGRKNDTRSEQGFNDYSIIGNELYIYHPSIRVDSKAPMIVPRGNFINAILSDNFNGLTILINPKCKKTIEDLTYQKESPTGKDKKKGKVNGIVMELLGHCFAAGTKVTTDKGDVNIEDVKVGDMVLTRQGYKPVTRSGVTGRNRVVKDYTIGGVNITCTPDHKFVIDGVFTPVDTRHNGVFYFLNQPEFSTTIGKENSLCPILLPLTESTSRATPNPITALNKSIIQAGLSEMEYVSKPAYTATYGKKSTVASLPGTTFTTATETHSITSFLTSNVSTVVNTYHTICRMKHEKQHQNYIYHLHRKKQRNGIQAKRVSNGIRKMLKLVLLNGKQAYTPVQNVVTHTKQKNSVTINSAPVIVYPTTAENRELITSLEIVLSAKQSLQLTDTRSLNAVAVNVVATSERRIGEVYDITVADCPEFFANGILVHNCSDTFDYLICQLFSTEFASYLRGNKKMNYLIGRPQTNSKFRL